MNSRQRRRIRRKAARIIFAVRPDIEVTDRVALDLVIEACRLLWLRRGGKVFVPGSKKSRAGQCTRRTAQITHAWKCSRRSS